MARYADAILWMADNDDTEWAIEPDEHGEFQESVTASLTADLFGKTIEQVIADLRKALKRHYPERFGH